MKHIGTFEIVQADENLYVLNNVVASHFTNFKHLDPNKRPDEWAIWQMADHVIQRATGRVLKSRTGEYYKVKNVYYAHSVSIYDTPTEDRDLELLTKLGFSPLNPNTEAHSENYKKLGMEYFDRLIKKCDLLAFRAHPNGDIPAGVAKEIETAHKVGIPVFEIPTGVLRRTLSVEETREYLKDAGER